MKKLYFLMLGAIAVSMAACSDEEPSLRKTDGEAIDFRPGFNGSRATETTNANLNSITVTAIDSLGGANYFTDLTFDKGGDGFFTSSPVYFWPGDDRSLTFYAYSPTMDVLGADITIDASTKEMTNFVIADSIRDQVDFVTAIATGKKSANETSGVELTFKHQLSQIELQAKSDSKAYKFEVAGMRIGRVEYIASSFDFTTSQWTLDDWHDTFVYTSSCSPVVLSSDPVSIMGDSGNAMLLPQTLRPWDPINDPDNVARERYLGALVRVTTADGDVVYPLPGDKRTYGWVSIPLSGTWEAGKRYVYTLDFTKGAGYIDPDDPNPGKPVIQGEIKFNVEVSDWVNNSKDVSMEATLHK
ncbi:MAG: fimbrillin family protein [Paramuribaculum sp.]|nr:fimbrillin family protein [Paramuribaculum sp.]